MSKCVVLCGCQHSACEHDPDNHWNVNVYREGKWTEVQWEDVTFEELVVEYGAEIAGEDRRISTDPASRDAEYLEEILRRFSAAVMR